MAGPESGGPDVYIASTTVTLPSLSTQGTTVAGDAQNIVWTTWTQVLNVVDTCSVKFVDEREDITPLRELWRTHDCTIKRGIESIDFMISRRGVSELLMYMTSASSSNAVAGSSQTGQDIMYLGTNVLSSTAGFQQLCFDMRTELDYWDVIHFPRVKANETFDLSFAHAVTKIPASFKVFNYSTGTAGQQLFRRYRMTGVKTG